MLDMSEPAPDQTCSVCHTPGHLWCAEVPNEVTDVLALIGGVAGL